jgi:hypothetical protein
MMADLVVVKETHLQEAAVEQEVLVVTQHPDLLVLVVLV